MKNLARLREAAARIKANPNQSNKYLQEALRLLETEFSHDEIYARLYAALRVQRYTTDGAYVYRWISRVYSAFFIYSEEIGDAGAKQFKRDYSIDDSGVVTLGEAIEVYAETKFISVASGEAVTGLVTESEEIDDVSRETKPAAGSDNHRRIEETQLSRSVWLTESANTTEAPSDIIRIKIIAPGQGSSGFYPREVLERDIPRIFPIGTHMYANHPTSTEMLERPERDVRDLVSTIVSTPVYEADNPAGEGSYADVKVYGSWLGFVQERAKDIGVSINAFGTAEQDENGAWNITSLDEGLSVDYVTRAGAGGQIVSLQEAAKDAQQLTRESTPKDNDVTPEEAQKLRDENAALQTENATFRENAARAKARTVAATAIESANLPDAAKTRIVESAVVTLPRTEAGALDEAALQTSVKESAQKEADYLAEALGNGPSGSPVFGNGDSVAAKEATAPNEADQAFALLLG